MLAQVVIFFCFPLYQLYRYLGQTTILLFFSKITKDQYLAIFSLLLTGVLSILIGLIANITGSKLYELYSNTKARKDFKKS
jgi:hypothetical protein